MTRSHSNNEQQVYEIIMLDPPTKYVEQRKRPGYDNKGKLVTQTVYYLTANIFYDGTHFMIKQKIVDYAKNWLFPQLRKMPKFEKCRIELEYIFPTDNFDLDNKAYFWLKLILDLMKTPSSKQVLNRLKKNKQPQSLCTLRDDTVRYVPEIKISYTKGAPAIRFKVEGTKYEEQLDLFL